MNTQRLGCSPQRRVVLLLVFGSAFSAYLVGLQQVRRRMMVTAQIRNAGGVLIQGADCRGRKVLTVLYPFVDEETFSDVIYADVSAADVDDQLLYCVADLDTVEELVVSGRTFHARDIASLLHSENLQSLTIHHPTTSAGRLLDASSLNVAVHGPPGLSGPSRR